MTDPPPDPADDGRPAEGDDEYARAYADGFGEGLREALKEVLQHASRGHTTQELRLIVESRLARVAEDVDRKRRSLVRPPRRPAWGALLRGPEPPAPWSPTPQNLSIARVGVGQTVLFREERPARAIEALERSQSGFPRLLLITIHPPTLSTASEGKAEIVRVAPASNDPGRSGISPGEIGGRLRAATESPGGALVYLDALEFLTTEYSVETSLKFLHFATTQAIDSRSALIASVDPNALDPRDLSRVQRAFGWVA
ncbi:MAG TPA: DUF835 domain-containing protein [Thermoplasmata archaeon]|nr:DUF835 domain-containing protein [Thermoplasmata archaeon]